MMTLLIGGPADGKRISVEKGAKYWMYPEESVPVPITSMRAFAEFGVTNHTYVREALEPGGFGVYRHSHLETEDLIEMLLEGYRKPLED